MKKLNDFLNGRKTIIGILLGAIYSVLIATNVVRSDEMVWTAILTFTGISFRLALNKR